MGLTRETFLFILLSLLSPAWPFNAPFFTLYTGSDHSTVAHQENGSLSHLPQSFKRVMANTHRVCCNGIWAFFPAPSFAFNENHAHPYGYTFGKDPTGSTRHCYPMSEGLAMELATMGSLRLLGPPNDLDEISLRTYTGPYYSGIESVIDMNHREDRNLRGYIESFVITGPSNEYPIYNAFIASFVFYSEERFQGRKVCVVMSNDVHGNYIPPKGAGYASPAFPVPFVNETMSANYGSVKLIPYDQVYSYCEGLQDIVPATFLYYSNSNYETHGNNVHQPQIAYQYAY